MPLFPPIQIIVTLYSMVYLRNLLNRLQLVQNAAALTVCKIPKYDHISSSLHTLHWLPVEHRIILKICLLTWKALHGFSPKYIQDLLVPHNTSSRSLRSTDQKLLVIPKTLTKTFSDRSFSVAAPFLWNKLQIQIKLCNDINVFKSHLKTYLFRETIQICCYCYAPTAPRISFLDRWRYRNVYLLLLYRVYRWHTGFIDGIQGLQMAYRVYRWHTGFIDGIQGLQMAYRVYRWHTGFVEGIQGLQMAYRVYRWHTGFIDGIQGLQMAYRVYRWHTGFIDGNTWFIDGSIQVYYLIMSYLFIIILRISARKLYSICIVLGC